jgi:hypothetical protein
LDLGVAQGRLTALSWVDPVLLQLQQRGLVHERKYANELIAKGLTVADLASCAAAKECTKLHRHITPEEWNSSVPAGETYREVCDQLPIE